MGGNISAAYAINNSGNIVGYSTTTMSGNAHAILYVSSNDTLYDLGYLMDGGTEVDAIAFAISDSGTIVGYSENYLHVHRAVTFSGGNATDLGSLVPASDAYGSSALGVNLVGNNTIIVGRSDNDVDAFHHAFRYTNGTMTSLTSVLSNSNSTLAYAINATGTVVGEYRSGNRILAYSLTGNTMTSLGALSANLSSEAVAINSHGVAVGDGTTLTSQTHALRFANGNVTDLGTVGGNFSLAKSINASGQIVGISQNATNAYHAFIYDGGTMYDLNDLIDDTDWELESAQGINDSGQIVGYGSNPDGAEHAYLLTPVDEAPMATLSPGNRTAAAGTNTTFGASFSGVPTPTLQWQRAPKDSMTFANLTNDSTYANVTEGTLTVKKLTAAMSGDQFRCVGTNMMGSSTTTAGILVVYTLPSITTQPKAVSTTKGKTVTFNVVAAGDKPLTYAWQKSNVNLKNGGVISGVTTATLKLTKVTATNAGSYRVLVTNKWGKATSNTVKLTVK
jgi:probable HAF family extracellular repeat protein